MFICWSRVPSYIGPGSKPGAGAAYVLAAASARSTGPADLSFDEASVETHRLLDAAVERQLLSDVPIGGFLSGGIDSSILSHLCRWGGQSVRYLQRGLPAGRL